MQCCNTLEQPFGWCQNMSTGAGLAVGFTSLQAMPLNILHVVPCAPRREALQ